MDGFCGIYAACQAIKKLNEDENQAFWQMLQYFERKKLLTAKHLTSNKGYTAPQLTAAFNSISGSVRCLWTATAIVSRPAPFSISIIADWIDRGAKLIVKGRPKHWVLVSRRTDSGMFKCYDPAPQERISQLSPAELKLRPLVRLAPPDFNDD